MPHYRTDLEQIKALRKAGNDAAAASLIEQLLPEIEAEALAQRSAPPRWYFEQLAIIRRKQRLYHQEVQVLEQFAAVWARVSRDLNPLAERLVVARALATRQSNGEPSRSSPPPATGETVRLMPLPPPPPTTTRSDASSRPTQSANAPQAAWWQALRKRLPWWAYPLGIMLLIGMCNSIASVGPAARSSPNNTTRTATAIARAQVIAPSPVRPSATPSTTQTPNPSPSPVPSPTVFLPPEGVVRVEAANLRRAVRIDTTTLWKMVCADDRLEYRNETQVDGLTWYAVRVVGLGADCATRDRAAIGDEGWIAATVVSAPVADVRAYTRASGQFFPSIPDPTPSPRPAPTQRPAAPAPARGGCDASYPGVCIPPRPPDLDCGEIPYRNFRVVGNDPHGFDRDRDGIGCES